MRQSSERVAAMRRQRLVREKHQRSGKIMRASILILVMALLNFGLGTLVGMLFLNKLEPEYAALDAYSDDEPILLSTGETMTVAERRDQLNGAVRLVFAPPYIIAAIFLGLFFWARRSPFPAMVTALCLYVMVALIVWIMNPIRPPVGWLDIVVFVFLLGGIKAALAERKAKALEAASAA